MRTPRLEPSGFPKLPLPLPIPYAPIEATRAETLPEGEGWQFEPKWDGFRCLVFRSQDEVVLQSKAGQPLARYFPELVAGFRNLRAQAFVLDGEVVIPIDGALSFDTLLQRTAPGRNWIYGQGPRGTEPVVRQAKHGLDAAFAAAGVRGPVRLLFSEPVSPRQCLSPLAAGQRSEELHDGAGPTS